MKISYALLFVFGVLLWSCEGEQGPAGPDGLITQIFEAEVDFTPENNFEMIIDIPASIEVYTTDIVMAYVLAGVDNDIDIWEPLPQTWYFDEGVLVYAYDYTFQDIRFFIDGTVDPTFLLPEFTQSLIFRIAVIPADMTQSVDVNNYNEVMNAIKDHEILKAIN